MNCFPAYLTSSMQWVSPRAEPRALTCSLSSHDVGLRCIDKRVTKCFRTLSPFTSWLHGISLAREDNSLEDLSVVVAPLDVRPELLILAIPLCTAVCIRMSWGTDGGSSGVVAAPPP